MEVELTPKVAKKVYEGEGGSYLTWFPSEVPMLKHGNIGAAKLFLNKFGFALPHYADSSKIGFVLQGKGVVGVVFPEKEEKVIEIKEGDAIAIPFGVTTWWFNKQDTQLIIVFLGETSKAHKPGEFTYFFLNGSNGIFTGFSTEFVSRAWDLPQHIIHPLVNNQTSQLIVKLNESNRLPDPIFEHRNGVVFNCLEAALDVDVKGGGQVVVLNAKRLPLVGEIGLGADLVRLNGKAMCSPGFSCDSALQVTYIVKGSGRVQIVGSDGKRVLDSCVKQGDLFIVPRFFVVSKIADDHGLEWFSIITTPNPVFTHLAGKTSVWKALSPGVLEAAFNVSSEVVQEFRSKRTSDEIFFPPN
ncbi:unnamed protein product [Amaranthus hypochondriacus]